MTIEQFHGIVYTFYIVIFIYIIIDAWFGIPKKGEIHMLQKSIFYQHLADCKESLCPIIGVGVGSGLSARAAELGRADFLATYHTAMYRMHGLPTVLSFLPYSDCNKMVLEGLATIRCNVKNIPLLAGLGAHDPRTDVSTLVKKALDKGADGIVNEPFCGSYGTMIRQGLEQCGLGFKREYEMIKAAINQGTLALGWAHSLEEAVMLAAAGTPLIGLIIDANTLSSDILPCTNQIIEYIDHIVAETLKENPAASILLHGKYVDNYDSAQYIISHSLADGCFTGSHGERIPTENAITNTVLKYKGMYPN